MADLLTTTEIRAVIKETCEKLGVPSMYPKIKLLINKRIATCFGKAIPSELTVIICTKLYSASTVEKRRNTIIHETCHLIAFAAYGPRIKPHGREWKTLMVRMGEDPKTKGEVKVDPNKPLPGRKRVYCGCGPMDVTPRMFNKMARNHHIPSVKGTGYHCRKCKHTIELKQEDVQKFNRWARAA